MDNTESILAKIETHFKVSLPVSYRNWMLSGDGVPLHLCDNYLQLPKITWLPPQDIIGFNLWRTNIIPGLIPFAVARENHVWCFNTQVRDDQGECEILYCERHETLAEVYAPSLRAWLYRRCLEFAAGEFLNYESEVEKARHKLSRWADQFAELFPRNWVDCLRSLALRPLFEYPERTPMIPHIRVALMPIDEVRQLIAHEFGERYVGPGVLWGTTPPISEAIDEVEHHFGLSLPRGYRDLALRGCMSYSSDNYLDFFEAEWIPPDEIRL